MDTRHFRYLLAVADHKSIGRAARSLHITQPALSKSLQHMEAWYGARLFERHKGGASPTAYGEVVVSRVRRMVAELDESRREVGLLKGEEDRRVRVGAGPFYSEYLLAPTIGRLLGKFPDTSFGVQTGSRTELLERLFLREIDLYVSYVEQADRNNPDLTVLEVRFPQVVFYCRASHPVLQQGEAALREALAHYPTATATPPLRASQWLEDRAGSGPRNAGGKGAPRGPSVTCELHQALKRIVENSDAIGIAPLPVVEEEVDAGRFRLVPVPPPEFDTPCGIVHLKRRTLTPAAAALVAEMERGAAELAA